MSDVESFVRFCESEFGAAVTVSEHVDGTREYVLGIDGEAFVERADPETAAITAIVGSPVQRPPLS